MKNELQNGRLAEQEEKANENLHNNLSQSRRLEKDHNLDQNNLNRKYISFNSLPMNSDENQDINSYNNHLKY